MTVGITGGSGCGTTAFGQALARRGFYFIDADAVYHRLLKRDQALNAQIAAAFPGCADAEGRVDRAVLRGIVFRDAAALQRLNAVTHPAVVRAIEAQCAAHKQEAGANAHIAVEAVALLECGLQVNRSVAVLAQRAVRIARIQARDKLSFEEAAARIDAQAPDRYYIDRCDHIVFNNGTLEQLERLTDSCMEQWTEWIAP